MLDFRKLELNTTEPVYVQIVSFVKRQIFTGAAEKGESLPSRRELAAILKINPNTVQKAFHLLEEEQLIESRTGAKSCMTLPEKTLAALRQELLSEELRNAARTLRQMGITKEDALRLLAQAWEEEET